MLLTRLYKYWPLLGFVFSACKEPFVPFKDPNTEKILVVDGFIDTGGGETTIRLTQTADMMGPVTYNYVPSATLKIEGEDGTTITAITNAAGVAVFSTKINNQTQRYKLSIATQSGRKYSTNFLDNIKAPKLDSIGYKIEALGIQLYLNTDDKANNTRYYGWSYEETYEIEAIKPKYQPLAMICWANNLPTEILAGSSIKLSDNRITGFPLTFIKGNSIKLNKMYSINVSQYGLTEKAYNYLVNIKKNTEKIGSIFDPQPSETIGNIRCDSDPSEPVIGFINCGTVSQKRIFIRKRDIPRPNNNWIYLDCDWQPVSEDPDPEFYYIEYERGMVPWTCVDCTLNGASTTKPAFWPK
jgi:hypothetical protein